VVQDYGTARSNDVQALAPRGVERVLRDLVGDDMLYVVTGSAGQRVSLPTDRTGRAAITADGLPARRRGSAGAS
jgi:hypothetical protein